MPTESELLLKLPLKLTGFKVMVYMGLVLDLYLDLMLVHLCTES